MTPPGASSRLPAGWPRRGAFPGRVPWIAPAAVEVSRAPPQGSGPGRQGRTKDPRPRRGSPRRERPGSHDENGARRGGAGRGGPHPPSFHSRKSQPASPRPSCDRRGSKWSMMMWSPEAARASVRAFRPLFTYCPSPSRQQEPICAATPIQIGLCCHVGTRTPRPCPQARPPHGATDDRCLCSGKTPW